MSIIFKYFLNNIVFLIILYRASHTFKFWSQPRFSVSSTCSYDVKTQQPVLGFWLVLDTNSKLEHHKATASFKESVGYTVASQIDYEDEEFV